MLGKNPRLGNVLQDMGLLNEEQLVKALSIQKKSDEPLGKILINQGIISQKDLARALAKEHHLTFCDISRCTITPEVIRLIPEEQCSRYTLIPLEQKDDVLSVALADPLNLIALDNLRMFLGKEIKGLIAPEDDIKNAIQKHYHGTDATQTEQAVSDADSADIMGLMITDADDAQDHDAPVIKLVSKLILEAFKRRASDIHVEPFKDRVRVRYRIDGILHEIESLAQTLQGSIISRLKIMAKLDIAEKRLPQDGRIKLMIAGKDVDFRVSTLPSIYGESVVLRILDRSQLLLHLSDLGFLEREQKLYEDLITMPNGVILVTGPTGSGKTTTLYTSLSAINKPDRKIITVEDPIEYQLSGINQVQIKPTIGLTFSSALRSILRQAPNIIMIGEIRDVETARIAIEASLTGHLVFSTLHTNDAPGGVIRLIDMGIKPYLVASSVQAIIAQRLVRTICPQCKTTVDANTTLLKALDIPLDAAEKKTFFKGSGCAHCSFTGYKGRIAIFELFRFTDEIRALVYENTAHTALRERARQYGMRTLREDGISKALQGITTLEEVIRVTQSDVS